MTKGFWLPLGLLHDKNTTMQEKLLLIEINQLSMLDKGCIASNSHFAELFKVKKESVSRSLSSLEQKGYITTKIKDGSRNHERTITINKMLFRYEQNVTDPLTKCLETKENKTNNKTDNTKGDIFERFINYLKSNCKYKSKVTVTKETKSLFNKIENKQKLALDYLEHQKEKGDYSVRLTKYLMDYETVYNCTSSNNDWA